MLRGLLLCLWLWPQPAVAGGDTEKLRLAVFTVALDRAGPGLLLRDLLDGDPQAEAAARVIAAAAPDAVLLVRFDYDAGGLALAAFAETVAALGGPVYDHRLALKPNSGLPTGLDMDGDGRLGGPRDAQGYGAFSGQGGMALLSRLPIDRAALRDFSELLWRDLPGAVLPIAGGKPFPSPEAQAAQRLHAVGAWSVPLLLPDGGQLELLAFHATPPVFDGPEDRNGLRNADEIRFWQVLLDGELPWAPPDSFVLLGNANLDPERGDGRREAIRALLDDPRLSDPRPRIAGDDSPAALATGLWDPLDGPGPLRVDYVLPAATLTVAGTGLLGPANVPTLAAEFAAAGLEPPLHLLVWVDLAAP